MTNRSLTVPRRRHAAAPLAALAVLGSALSGCAASEDPNAAAIRGLEERLSSAEARIQQLEDAEDRRVDVGQLGSQAGAAASSAGARAGAAASSVGAQAQQKVEEIAKSLPAAPDPASVKAVQEQGKVIVEYGRDALQQDPAQLEQAMKDVAEKAKQAVPDVQKMEFKVGDTTFTF